MALRAPIPVSYWSSVTPLREGRGFLCDVSDSGWSRALAEGRERKGEARGPGGRGQVATMSPLPARGTGSCGPAVSTSAPQPESAAATATMGGKNKQRTKGNLRVRLGAARRSGVCRAVSEACGVPAGWAGRGVGTQTASHGGAVRGGARPGRCRWETASASTRVVTCPGGRGGRAGAVGGSGLPLLGGGQ